MSILRPVESRQTVCGAVLHLPARTLASPRLPSHDTHCAAPTPTPTPRHASRLRLQRFGCCGRGPLAAPASSMPAMCLAVADSTFAADITLPDSCIPTAAQTSPKRPGPSSSESPGALLGADGTPPALLRSSMTGSGGFKISRWGRAHCIGAVPLPGGIPRARISGSGGDAQIGPLL
jgi:hypothetical protein